MDKKIHESEYGGSPCNFHIDKHDDTLHVELTYPPWTDADNKNDQCRYVFVNQEATRASDGVRLHYDYARDGFVVEQPRRRIKATKRDKPMKGSDQMYDFEEIEDWVEVAFCESWQFDATPCGGNFDEAYIRAIEEADAAAAAEAVDRAIIKQIAEKPANWRMFNNGKPA